MILGISGKKQSGKNTFARIVNTIVSNPHFTDEAVLRFINRHHNNNFIYKYKAFAEKIKVMVSLLTGYSLEELEDREIKESELGEEWWVISKPEIGMFIPYSEDSWAAHGDFVHNLIRPTPRLLLQLLGTEFGRNIIHPDVWVNALFSDYKSHLSIKHKLAGEEVDEDYEPHEDDIIDVFPKWIITDVRFPNEMDAIQKRDGIVVRIKRDKPCHVCGTTKYERGGRSCKEISCPSGQPLHESETALDDRTDFDYVIQNDGSLLSLVVIARHFIKQFKL